MEWNSVIEVLNDIVDKEVGDGHSSKYPDRIGNSIVMAATLSKNAIEESLPSAQVQQSLKPVLRALSKLRCDLEAYDIEDDGYAVATAASITESVRNLNRQIFLPTSVGDSNALGKEELQMRLDDILRDRFGGGGAELQALQTILTLVHSAAEQSLDLAIEHQTLLPILLSFSKIRAQVCSEYEDNEKTIEILTTILKDVVALQYELGVQGSNLNELCSLRWTKSSVSDYRAEIDNNMEEIVRTAKSFGADAIKLVWAAKADSPEEISLLKIPDQALIGGIKAKFTAVGQVNDRLVQESCIQAIAKLLKFSINIEFKSPE